MAKTWAMKVFTFLSYCLLTIFALTDQIIELPQCKVKCNENSNILECFKIPYAQPPVGEYRFQAPQTLTHWDEEFCSSDSRDMKAVCTQ